MKQFVNDTEYEIIWLKRSSTEIETIYSFYKHFASEVVAKRRIGIIIHSVDILKKMPYIGKKDEDFTHIREYRFVVVLAYKIYYFIENNKVYISSIWDCRQGNGAF